jgi:CRP-like cAMP-binding protein
MVLKWIGASRDSDDVSELIARKKYSRAIEVLREQFKLRPPGVQTRLQFVDVLILAGRGREAVPILVGLAEELAADGFTSKAIALLKRVEKIEAGRADVEGLMARLVVDHPARDRSHVPSFAGRETASSPGFDLEEIGAETDQPPAEGASLVEARVEAGQEAPESAPIEATPAEPSQAAETEALAETAVPAGETAPSQEAEPSEVKSQIRGAFRRFLEGLDEEATGGTAAEPVPSEGPEALVSPPAEPALAPAGATEEPTAAPEAAPEEPERKPARRRRGGFLRRLFGGAEEEEKASIGEPPTAEEAETPAESAPAGEAGLAEPLVAAAEAGVEPEPDGSTATAAALEPVIETLAEPPGEAEPVVEAEPMIEASAAPAPEVQPEAEPEVEARPDVEPAGEPALAMALEPQPPVLAEPAIERLAGPATEVEPDDRAPERPEAYLRQLLATSEEGGLDEAGFQDRVLDLIEEVLQQPVPREELVEPEPVPPAVAQPEPGAEAPPAPVRTRGVQESAQRLAANPLLRELSDEERLEVVRGMRLHTYEAGDIVATEGEPGESLFTVITGAVRVFVKSPTGHNFEMGLLREGEFFGEISSISGRPRTSTVVATTHTELLELDRATVERIARRYPRVREILESAYLQRASSPEAAAIRAVPVDPSSRRRAIEVLEAYFGESRWDPRMRLRLADLLVRTGKEDDAVPLLVGLAEDLERAGYPEKAVAILKKIEKIRRRNIEEVNIAPLSRSKGAGEAAKRRGQARPAPAMPVGDVTQPVMPARPKRRAATRAHFESWIVDVVRDAVKPAALEPAAPVLDREGPVYARGLRASPLFEGLGEEELLAIIREFRLLSFDPGDVILTEGEPGQSLFILTAGSVRVHIRDARGHNVLLTELREGAFFGEMAVVSGKPRTATITARERCELLELEKASLDRVSDGYPRIRERIEEAYISRATSAQAASIRTRPAQS